MVISPVELNKQGGAAAVGWVAGSFILVGGSRELQDI